MYSFDSLQLMRRAFGVGREALYGQVIYRVGDGNISPSGKSEYQDIEILPLEGDVKDFFGRPVLSPVAIEGGRFTEKDQQGRIRQIAYPDYNFPHTTIIEINRPKLIVKTNVPGSSGGSFKEYITMDDYRIVMRGLIVNQENDYMPEQGIREFHNICQVPAALGIRSEFLEWAGIYDIVVEDCNVFQIEGFSHVVGFQVNALSDAVTEVRLRDGI